MFENVVVGVLTGGIDDQPAHDAIALGKERDVDVSDDRSCRSARADGGVRMRQSLRCFTTRLRRAAASRCWTGSPPPLARGWRRSLRAARTPSRGARGTLGSSASAAPWSTRRPWRTDAILRVVLADKVNKCSRHRPGPPRGGAGAVATKPREERPRPAVVLTELGSVLRTPPSGTSGHGPAAGRR